MSLLMHDKCANVVNDVSFCKCRHLLMNRRSSIREGNKWTDITFFFLLTDLARNDKQQMTRDRDNGGLEVSLLNVMYWWGLLHLQSSYSNTIRISAIFVHFSNLRPEMENFLTNWAKQAVKKSHVPSVHHIPRHQSRWILMDCSVFLCD